MALHTVGGATLMGLIQGLTEFLPVSSSGHLVLGSRLLGLTPPSLFFDVLLHVATLLPIVWVYRRDVSDMLAAIVRPGKWRQDHPAARARRLLALIALASLPAVVIGLSLSNVFAALFDAPRAVALALLCTGGILILTRHVTRRDAAKPPATLTAARALLIGCAQACAITPGISRSGTTIAAALLLGLERELAVRFSFLLSLPVIVGAALFEGLRADIAGATLPFAAGFFTAALCGYIALRIVIRTVMRGSFHWFALYVWALGGTVLLYLAQGG